jgi:hypothetical protein
VSDPPPDVAPRRYSDNQTAEEIHRVAGALETYTREQKATEARNAKHNRKILRWSRAATVGAIAYTLITACFLAATVRGIQEARRATHAASRAADAATRQAEISGDTEKRQLRAYVYVSPGPIKNFGTGNPEGNVTVSMIGQTPAYHVELVTSTGTLPFPFKGDLEKEAPAIEVTVQSILFPTTHVHNFATLQYIPNPEQLQILKLGQIARIYVWGHVNYKDAFRERHHVLFCFHYFGTALTDGSGDADICDQHVDSD